MVLLRNSAQEDPAKIAESELVEMKRANKLKELQYLESRRELLQIRAPVAGICITKDVDSLSGKSFKAGEAFCEIAVPTDLYCDVFVPEDRITYVQKGQRLTVYLNSDPARGFGSKVEHIAPDAEVHQRLGNVYRVRAPFPGQAANIRVGMKGIGKIAVAKMPLRQIIKLRVLTRWNRLISNIADPDDGWF